MIYAILAGICFSLQNVCNKLFGKSFKSTIFQLTVFDTLALIIGTGVLALLHFPKMISCEGMIWAIAFAAFFYATIALIALMLSKGPMGLSSLIMNMCVVVQVFFGCLVWGETLSFMQIIGLIILLCVIVLLSLPDTKETEKKTKIWLISALATLFCNAGLNIVQAGALKACPELKESILDFTFWCIACGAVLTTLITLIMRFVFRMRFEEGAPVKRLPLYSAGLGIITSVAYILHNTANSRLDSVVALPVVVGCNMGLVMVYSILFFGEKMTFRKGLAFALGIAGIIFMNF